MDSSCFRCRFALDLHIQPTDSLTATVAGSSTKNKPRSPLQETVGAAWPPGKPRQSVVFQVKLRETLSAEEIIEFNVSRSFLSEFRVSQDKLYCFKQFRQCPTLTCVVFEGDLDAISRARTSGWLSAHCEALVHEGSKLGELTVKHVAPFAFGLMSLSTKLVFVEKGRPGAQEEAANEVIGRPALSLTPIVELENVDLIERSISNAISETATADTSFDLDRCVFVSSELMRELSLTPFRWARLKTAQNLSVQVRIIPARKIPPLEDRGMQATWQLLFNLSSFQEAVPCEIEQIEFESRFAKSATFSLVASPTYVYRKNLVSCMLQYHLESPRLLSVGDVFAVSTADFFQQHSQMKTDQDNGATLYFVVQSVTGAEEASLWVQKGETSIMEQAETMSKIPTCAKICPPFHPLFNTPQSIFRKIREAARAVKLFYTKRDLNSSISPIFLISGPTSSGKSIGVRSIALSLGLHLRTVNGDDLTGDTAATAETRMKTAFEKVKAYGPCVLHMKNVDLVFDHIYDNQDTRLINSFVKSLKQFVSDQAEKSSPVAVIMTTAHLSRVPSKVMALVLQHAQLSDLSAAERSEALKILLSERGCSSLVSLETITNVTAGFLLGDLVAFARFAHKSMRKRVENLKGTEHADLCRPLITMDDAMAALKEIQVRNNKSIGAPQIPSVKWADVGGLEEAKKNILDTIQFPLKHPQFAQSGLTRSGILLYGPPGTGKTLLAKAVATECSLNFLSVKGPELINMYVGQSEENVRKVFEKARSVAPCIIFFDELDSLAPSRGRSADSGGVLDRVVSQLLAEMDGLSKSKQIFVVGATNRPDLLDSAVLRPGRLDRLIYVDIPEEAEVKLKVLEALTRKMKLDDVDLKSISEKCPKTYTGADLYSLCATAMTASVSRCIATGQTNIILKQADFLKALDDVKPSVGDAELARYRNLKKQFDH